MDKKPIKRHPALVPTSRDHHFGLLFCWKIRQGLKSGVEPERIKKYIDWFWDAHLQAHFEEEEKYIFPALPANHPMIVKAVSEHRRFHELILNNPGDTETFGLLEKELDEHIRFEERVLFNEIQQVATEEQLAVMAEHHKEPCPDDWADEFWEQKK